MSEDNNDREIYEGTIRLAFQKLTANEKDVIVVHLPEDIDHTQMRLVAQSMQPLQEEFGCLIMCVTDGLQVEQLNEADMNRHGWYKLHHSDIDNETRH